MSSAQLLKMYLPPACGRFIGSIVKILLGMIPDSEIDSFKAELGISINIRQQDSIPNARRKFTFLFQYPASGRYYIALLFISLPNIFAAGMGAPMPGILRTYMQKDHMLSYARKKSLELSKTVMIKIGHVNQP